MFFESSPYTHPCTQPQTFLCFPYCLFLPNVDIGFNSDEFSFEIFLTHTREKSVFSKLELSLITVPFSLEVSILLLDFKDSHNNHPVTCLIYTCAPHSNRLIAILLCRPVDICFPDVSFHDSPRGRFVVFRWGGSTWCPGPLPPWFSHSSAVGPGLFFPGCCLPIHLECPPLPSKPNSTSTLTVKFS